MDWKGILKKSLEEEKLYEEKLYGEKNNLKDEINRYFNEAGNINWTVHFPPSPRFVDRYDRVMFEAKPSTGTSLKVMGQIPDIPIERYADWAISRKTTPEDKIDYEKSGIMSKIEATLKPSFRSLDWVLETTTGISDIKLPSLSQSWGEGLITINADSGSEYTIYCTDLKDSGCYRVETEEGWYICIEMQDKKPVGDNLLGLILGLYNDEDTRNQIEGLDQYLDEEIEVTCEICEDYQSVGLKDEVYTCYTCGVTSDITNISFEPSVTFSLEPQGVDGPEGYIDGWLLPDYYLGSGEFHFGNKLFTLDDPNDYTLTVRDSPREELSETSEGDIYHNGGLFYNEEGYRLGVEFVYNQIESSRVVEFFDEYTNLGIEEVYEIKGYDNIAGSLWSDGNELYDDSGKIDSIENIYNASGMGEEEFIEVASSVDFVVSAEEILDYFGYTDEGDYWSKGGKYYRIDEYSIEEIDESEIAKNLSSKSVLPINMKWTDYLRKNSNTKAEDWESALKSFISDGKKLGIPLSVMELLKLAKEATTSQSEGFETLHRPTFSEEEEEDV